MKKPPEKRVIFSLGANLGRRAATLSKAVEALGETSGLEIDRQSALFETQPWGITSQPLFYNQCVSGTTTLDGFSLLTRSQKIEQALGRNGIDEKWGPKFIDIDILLLDDDVIDTPELCLPHPQIRKRAFVLLPLRQIHPDLRIDGEELDTLISALPEADIAGVRPLS